MRFEKLTDNKIKIFFTYEDMLLNNVSTDVFLNDSSVSQKILQNAISEAESELGFKADDSKLLVEAISFNDGFVFTITKLVSSDSSINTCVYKFDSFDNFLDFCTYLKSSNIPCPKNSSLFSLDHSYYLIVRNNNLNSLSMILSEFASCVAYSAKFDGHLNEYGFSIFPKNAVLKGLNMLKKQ